MKKLDIYAGLLGAGKTTLINKMLTTAYAGSRVAIIENEMGKASPDTGDAALLQVRPLTSGCVCCTLKGDMAAAVQQLLQEVDPDYILIEAAGAADMQTIRSVCRQIPVVQLNRCIMLVNARKIRPLLQVVGQFYYRQLQQARTIYMNFTEKLSAEEIPEISDFLRDINPEARIISVPLDRVDADTFPDHEGDPEVPREEEAYLMQFGMPDTLSKSTPKTGNTRMRIRPGKR